MTIGKLKLARILLVLIVLIVGGWRFAWRHVAGGLQQAAAVEPRPIPAF
jgi:hypothetical protein